MSKGKVCFVIQRYGKEVNGGAELQCKLFAEHLTEAGWDVTVATTKAVDYISWRDEYTSDEEELNGVHIRRFSVERERDEEDFRTINEKAFNGTLQPEEEQTWLEKQGPCVPALIDYLKRSKDEYDAFVLFTYLYYPAVMGMREVKDKAIFIPEAHDEIFLNFQYMKDLFGSPRAYFFNTEEERQLVQSRFQTEHIPSDIGGIGIDVPTDIDGERFQKKYGLKDYIVYVGRVDEGKNCPELFDFFMEYKHRNPSGLKLVLIGKSVITVPEVSDIINLGFVSEQDKYDGMAGAKELVLPSKFESLSMVVLEAMAVGTPVVVNGACDVLKGHCIKSNGALYYNDYFQFEGELNLLAGNADIISDLTCNAKHYVDENYRWEVLIPKLEHLMEAIIKP